MWCRGNGRMRGGNRMGGGDGLGGVEGGGDRLRLRSYEFFIN